MESISADPASPRGQAGIVLQACLRGQPLPSAAWQALLTAALNPATATEASHALFSVIVERLADLFEPELCLAYADLFSEAIPRVWPELNPDHLRDRYRRIRQPHRSWTPVEPVRHVFVLSRVTLGADVAVTSILLQAAAIRFPEAEIHFVGPAKNYALFAADQRIRHVLMPYGRGSTLTNRLAVWPELRAALNQPGSLVIDPDSRLTQLGLLPVCPEDRYCFFESRSYGSETTAPLGRLTARWASETFGTPADLLPYLAPLAVPVPSTPRPAVSMSLGVGGNAAKQMSARTESQLARLLTSNYPSLWADEGPGGEETARVHAAVGGRSGVTLFSGDFAPFAHWISQSDFYAGYDSAGQHIAAAAGVPGVVLFKGFVSDRMFQRWQPCGKGRLNVIRVEDRPEEELWGELEAHIRRGAGHKTRSSTGG